MLRYTLMRLGIFAGCFVVVWALVYSGIAPRGLGASNGMWIVVLSLLVSAPISFVALRKERDRASAQIAPRLDRSIGRVKSNLAANRSQEDEVDDEARTQSPEPAEPVEAAESAEPAEAAQPVSGKAS
ncbi:DUF4229 domain-containing protein [Streptomyces europaeiscabiei]|nr:MULTISPECIES: DUF4229 domain-containing protein [Streptomyces]MDX3588358.1 DUF4229 domain-containing protein [Streptomyces europaeiscabiei]MDX3616520.1 DUF4229 domain-containing protein [Streptomyces europaeiscabiei]MDX3633547.1 DUF4229 domain-containing protein [Streptomyces europaeiscabiei]MDX3651154.1 DUF4229 domain-containing protein [Streptomyces europaeiscabiei]WUD34753.1 DUF4229 domain-containing protein [Streptomyces europaeiscabiei]